MEIIIIIIIKIIIIIIIIGFDCLEYYRCAKFQVIAIRGFRSIVLTYTPTHRDKVITIFVPPYYVVGMDYHINS